MVWNIYIYKMIWKMTYLLKFADDTTVFRKVKSYTDKHSLQDDLDKLVKWSEKCKCYSILGSVNA